MAGLDYDNLDQQVEARAEQLRNEAAKTKLNESVQSAGFGAGGPTGDIAGMLSRAPSAGDFALRLPKNVGAGLLKAAYHTVEAADDAIGAVAGADQAGNIAGGPPASFFVEQAGGSDEAVKVATPVQTPPLQTVFPEAFEAIDGFFSSLDENMTVPDGIVQGIAQFAIPFTGYLKALSGMKNVSRLASVGRLALAEGVAAGTAFDAHDGRLSDLVQIGRQAENEFGAVLRKLSPDDSALTAFVNWLSDRENEGVWGGRFKNAVDSLAGTAVTLGVIKAVPEALRLGRQVLEDAGKASGTIRSQTGHVSFHGTRHQFDEFSIAAMGSGEGAQAFGKGLYFAENPAVANSYKTAGRFSQGDDPGYLYQVEIPDSAVNSMLDWDKPLSEQPHILKALNLNQQDTPVARNVVTLDMTGQELHDALARGKTTFGVTDKQGAADFLKARGIPGIRYLDAGSRTSGIPLRQVKKKFLSELPEDAEFDEVVDLIGTGHFSKEQDAVLKALEADDWLGFDYPSQAINAAYTDLRKFDPSEALTDAVNATVGDNPTRNLVVFDDKLPKIVKRTDAGSQ